MASISMIKGDFGRVLTDKINEKVERLIRKYIDETITCKKHVSYIDNHVIMNMAELKRVFGKNGYQTGGFHCIAVVEIEKTLGFKITKDDYEWVIRSNWSDWFEDGCLRYRFFFCVSEYVSKNKAYDYYMRIGILMKGDINKTDEFKFEQPKYYDAFGNEINARDEIVWTLVTRGGLHHSIIDKIENGIAYLDDGKSISLLPNEKLDTVCVVTNKMNWMGMRI